jgi:hypothetical protein
LPGLLQAECSARRVRQGGAGIFYRRATGVRKARQGRYKTEILRFA